MGSWYEGEPEHRRRRNPRYILVGYAPSREADLVATKAGLPRPFSIAVERGQQFSKDAFMQFAALLDRMPDAAYLHIRMKKVPFAMPHKAAKNSTTGYLSLDEAWRSGGPVNRARFYATRASTVTMDDDDRKIRVTRGYAILTFANGTSSPSIPVPVFTLSRTGMVTCSAD